MTAEHDLDRDLAAWLQDGPSGSSEHPIESALAHARTHPRRRDPLAFLRKDPMSSHPSAAVLRPLPLVAVLGLLLVAALAVASAGGFFDRPPAVVPPPVATASPSVQPSITPSASAQGTPPATAGIGVLHVDLTENVGADATVDITDLSGTLADARSGIPGDGASVADGMVEVTNPAGLPDVLRLTWSGSPCDTTHAMTISQDGTTIHIVRPACSGDALPVDHVLELMFDHHVDPAKIKATIATSGS